MVVVVLPRSLVDLFPGAARRTEMDAATVGEVIDRLDERWPGMRNRLCDAGPEIRAYINVFVDMDPAGLSTPTPAGSTVRIIPAVAGG
ncbi:MAG TPA: MoaD/ThiS family protein [Candidatus Limnocylindrales bacterium]